MKAAARVLRPEPPPIFSEFSQIHRHWDGRRRCYIAKIAPGEYYVSRTGDELIGTVLGSCVAACVRDKNTGLGGMNHFMLPASVEDAEDSKCINAALRYGNFAMEHLLNTLLGHGSIKANLEVKLFGGGQVMVSQSRIGDRNVEFALEFLQTEGYTVNNQCVGGFSGRKVLYDPHTGKAWVKKIHSSEEQKLRRQEQQYLDAINTEPVSGEIELF